MRGQGPPSGETRGVSGRVAIVDDRAVFRAGVAASLATTGLVECGSIAEARARIPVAGVTVSIVRHPLPDGSGLELCRWLRSTIEGHRSLVLHAGATRRDLMDAIDAGAAGFEHEALAAADLRDAVARLDAGDTLLGGAALARLATTLPPGADPELTRRLAALSDRQRAIAALVAEGRRNAAIAIELGIAEQTVKNQVSRILDALGLDSRAQLAARLAAATR